MNEIVIIHVVGMVIGIPIQLLVLLIVAILMVFLGMILEGGGSRDFALLLLLGSVIGFVLLPADAIRSLEENRKARAGSQTHHGNASRVNRSAASSSSRSNAPVSRQIKPSDDPRAMDNAQITYRFLEAKEPMDAVGEVNQQEFIKRIERQGDAANRTMDTAEKAGKQSGGFFARKHTNK